MKAVIPFWQLEKSSWRNFYKNNRWAMFLAGVVALCCYWFQMSSFTFSMDEQALYGPITYIEFSRYGMIPLKWLAGSIPIFGSYNDILGVVFLVVFALILAQEFYKLSGERTSSFTIFAFMSFIISFPFNANYLAFSTYSFEVSLGLCLTAIALKLSNWFADSKKILFAALSILTLAYALSIYQSFLPVFALGVCFSLYLRYGWSNEDKITRQFFVSILKAILILGIAYLLYTVGDLIVRAVSNVHSSSYTDGFWAWKQGPIIETAKLLLQNIKMVLFGHTYETFTLYVLPATFILFAALLVLQLIVQKNRIITLICFAGMGLSPFLLCLGLGTMLPLRTLLGVGVFIACIWMLAGLVLQNCKVYKIAVALSIVVLLAFNSRATSQLLFSDYMAFQQERDLSIKISDRIERLGYGELPEQPVVYLGFHSILPSSLIYNSEVMGGAPRFFAHDSNIAQRFMETFGYNYTIPSQEDVLRAQTLSRNMPFWPDEGSVAYRDGLIIVNFLNVNVRPNPYFWSEPIEKDISHPRPLSPNDYHIYTLAETPDKLLIYGYLLPKAEDGSDEVYIQLDAENASYLFSTGEATIDLYYAHEEGVDVPQTGFMAQIDKHLLANNDYSINLFQQAGNQSYRAQIGNMIY